MQLHDSCLSGGVDIKKVKKNLSIEYDASTATKIMSASTSLDEMNTICSKLSLIDDHTTIVEAKRCLFRPLILLEMTRLLIEDAEKSNTTISEKFTLLINVSTLQQDPTLNNCAFCMIYNCEQIAMNLTDDDNKKFAKADRNGRQLFAHYLLKFKKYKVSLIDNTTNDSDNEKVSKEVGAIPDIEFIKVLNPDGTLKNETTKTPALTNLSVKEDSHIPPELHKLHDIAKDVLDQIKIRYRHPPDDDD